MLTYDRATNTYVDDPAKVFAGAQPLVDYPRTLATFQSEHGTALIISNIGMDREPFPRATNTLLMPDQNGLLRDYSKSLPQALEFSHDVSTAVINAAGDIGIYVNSMYIPQYFIMRDDRLIAANDRLPSAIYRDDMKFISSAMADLNGDGAADLILGTVNEHLDRSLVYLNDGSGRFGGDAIPLTRTPFPERKLQFLDGMVGASVVDIQPIKLDESQQYWDLVVVSTDAYMGYAIQLLKNDGSGNFTDVSSDRFEGPQQTHFNPIGRPFTWMYRAMLFETGDGVDIITKSDARFDVPSYVFGNNGDGTFSVAREAFGATYTSAARFGGTDMLVLINESADDLILQAYPE